MSRISLRRLLSAIALTTSAVAPVAADAKPEAPPELDASLCLDREQADPHDAGIKLGRGLAGALDEMRPLTATHLAAEWALSDDPVRRLALAHALEWTFPLVGDAMVIDHLSHDSDEHVRAAVARAAWVRGEMSVLGRLVDDPDPEVRAIASRARPH